MKRTSSPLSYSAAPDKDLQAAKAEWSQRLLMAPLQRTEAFRARAVTSVPTPEQNVVGVGIGEKLVGGRPVGVQALKFLVRVKYPNSQMLNKQVLPKQVDGLPVDVEEVGLLRALAGPAAAGAMPNPRIRCRPAQPGCSIGFQDPNNQFLMAGTFGAVVKKGGSLYILSNNHVLADENHLPLNAPIFQQGLLDGGSVTNGQIAVLTEVVPLRPGTMNQVDAALAKPLQNGLISRDVLFIGAPKGKTRAKFDMIVHKFGRTTGYTVGRITSLATDVTIQYESGNFAFQNQIIIVGLDNKPFSDQGDSGSLILERATQKAVGLLFAGSPTHTIANHITKVGSALGITLA